MGIFFHRKGPVLHAVVDVGSRFIKILVFERGNAAEAPKIIKKTATPIPLSYGPTRVVTRLRELLFDITKNFGRVPESTIVGFGPSIVASRLCLWTVPLVLQVKSITLKELHTYFDTLFEKNRDHTKAGAFSYPTDVLFNGYSVNPLLFLEKKNKVPIEEVSFRTILSYFFEETDKQLADIKRMLGGITVEFMPLGYAYEEAISASLGIQDAFLVDVGGKHTQLFFIKEGKLQGLTSFPLAGDHFVKGVAEVSGASFEEARDITRQYGDGLISGTKKAELASLLAERLEIWKKNLIEELDSFYHIGPLPQEVVLFGGGSYLPEIQNALSLSDWIKDFSYAATPHVTLLGGERVWQGEAGAMVHGAEEVGLGALMRYSLYHKPLF